MDGCTTCNEADDDVLLKSDGSSIEFCYSFSFNDIPWPCSATGGHGFIVEIMN